MIFNEYYTLSNGIHIPKLGLGTWFIDNDTAADTIKQAIQIGYRHIDTAQAYENESGVGNGIKNCGLARQDIFVTSKVAAEEKSYAAATKSIDNSLKNMGLDYIDMMIIHSPQPWVEFRGENNYRAENQEVWRALEDAYKAGKIRAIGVSNFLIDDLESLLPHCAIKPMVNQILMHIGNTPHQLVQYCQEHDILVEAYSPIAHGEALKSADITAMAKKYNVSTAQLCIKYVIQLGAIALPKTANPDHMRSNAMLDFVISDSDMAELTALQFADYGDYSHFPVFSGK